MRSQRGLSLVVVMIGLSIVSVILLAVFRLLDMSRDMAASLQDVIKSMDAMQEVRFAMADVATCTHNFGGIIPGTPTQPAVVPGLLEFAVGATTPPPPGNDREGTNASQGGNATGQVGSGAQVSGGPEGPSAFLPTDLPVITFGGLGETTVRVDRVTVNLRNPAVPNAAEINVEMIHLGRRAGQKLRTRSVPMWIKTDGSGRIVCCNTRNSALCP